MKLSFQTIVLYSIISVSFLLPMESNASTEHNYFNILENTNENSLFIVDSVVEFLQRRNIFLILITKVLDTRNMMILFSTVKQASPKYRNTLNEPHRIRMALRSPTFGTCSLVIRPRRKGGGGFDAAKKLRGYTESSWKEKFLENSLGSVGTKKIKNGK